jgi:iodotyrosine deiodinase
MKQAEFTTLEFTPIPETEMLERSKDFYNLLKRRRTVRDFSDKPVPKEIIEQALLTAGSNPGILLW